MKLKEKPLLSFWQIWNMSIGFLGIQFGFALQNGNASRILQNFGANVEHLSWFWLVAPITGMLVQPIIGYYSDHTWTRLGRRRPFFLAGAIFAALALFMLPNSGWFIQGSAALFIGAGMLMIMDASMNVAMEPFRALVADNLPDSQRTLGFSVQTFLIGVGAVAGSILPYALSNWFGFSQNADQGGVAQNVYWSFYIGGAVLLIAIIYTVVSVKEYSPKEYEAYHGKSDEEKFSFLNILKDFSKMPATMRQLGLVQFFSWFALFTMWVFTTPAIAQAVFKVPPGDTDSTLFNQAGDWVGIMFGVYNAVAAIYALFLPAIVRKIGRKATHAISLCAGGAGFIAISLISTPNLLLIPMVGIGMAWASILAMPYAMLAGSIPAGKMGVYMGIFNFFITFPQIVNGIIGGLMLKYLFNQNAMYSIVLAGVLMFCAALSLVYVNDGKLIKLKK